MREKEFNVLVPHAGSIGGTYAYRTVARTAKEAKREAAHAAGLHRVPRGTKAKVLQVYKNNRRHGNLPVKMRRAPKGWIKAKAVKIVRQNGKKVVLIKR